MPHSQPYKCAHVTYLNPGWAPSAAASSLRSRRGIQPCERRVLRRIGVRHKLHLQPSQGDGRVAFSIQRPAAAPTLNRKQHTSNHLHEVDIVQEHPAALLDVPGDVAEGRKQVG